MYYLTSAPEIGILGPKEPREDTHRHDEWCLSCCADCSETICVLEDDTYTRVRVGDSDTFIQRCLGCDAAEREQVA